MSSRKLIKEKSLYTLKDLHAKTNVGNIYENDYVTIVRHDGIYDDAPLFSESNFKFKIKTDENNKKRHVKNGWVLNENGEVWTKENIDTNAVSKESEIVLKPNYTSLNNFAYYGSAVELIENTVRDIITRFPGGLYYYGENAPEVEINGVSYYFISNECEIDCWTDNVASVEKNINPLRYLSYSFASYNKANGNPCERPVLSGITGTCRNTIIGEVNIAGTLFYVYKDEGGSNHLVTDNKNASGLIIEPNDSMKSLFWDNLTDFESVLLNRNTTPIYKAIFDTYGEGEDGIYYTPKSYIWPTVANSMTPDLTTISYQGYINSLLDLAEFHDEYDSDNMWRMMTHDSIKNMDSTISDDDVDSSRIKILTQLQGFQFDEIKRHIDSLKHSNSITYNEQANMPDYFLSDVVENYGWESRNVCTGNGVLANNIIHSGANNTISTLRSSGKTSSDVNVTFLKTLALSLNYIHSMKGTKRGIEAILGMFGFDINGETPDVTITEYYAKVNDEILPKYSDWSCLRAAFDYVNEESLKHFMDGYPVALIEGDDTTYLAPWYNVNDRYIGDFYYQSKGGWGKINKKYSTTTHISEVTSFSGTNIYRETSPYILCVSDLTDLTRLFSDTIKENMICYVEDITGLDAFYPNVEECSHYFVLNNTYISTVIGVATGGSCSGMSGWTNILKSEYDGSGDLTVNGSRVLNIESITPISKGNNPHKGNGSYDFGYDYLDKYRHIFREAIADGACDNLDEASYNAILNCGFDLKISGTTNGKAFEYITEDNELDSYRIVNTKNLTIRFNTVNDEVRKYITNTVIPYIENMIPSTMIVEYLFGNEESYTKTMQEMLDAEVNTQVLSTPMPADEVPNELDIWGENDIWNE